MIEVIIKRYIITVMLMKFLMDYTMVLYLLIVVLIVALAFYFYKRSIKSRKYFMCPNCKEVYRTEHMTSTTCKVCGSEVVEVNNKDVTDKTF